MKMTAKKNQELCCRILYGAMGDLAQNRDGAFCYRLHDPEHDLPNSPGMMRQGEYLLDRPLVTVTRETMSLTVAGAIFILDNLPPDDRREAALLERFARGEG